MKRIPALMLTLALCLTTAAFAAPVPDTGQGTCFNASVQISSCPEPDQSFYGQDAQYTINKRSYTDLENGIVRDNVTGLEWVQDGNLIANRDPSFDADGTAGDGQVTWQRALEYVTKLNTEVYLGHSDWRLPSAHELMTLVDYSDGTWPNYAFWGQYFAGTMPGTYWSATSVAGPDDGAWAATFTSGVLNSRGLTSLYYVRAVRGGVAEPEERFVDNEDGTVTDTLTGLMWQQNSWGITRTWEGALAYCEDLDLADYSDWRLPSVTELQSIVDYQEYMSAIDEEIFSGTSTYPYWTSTTYPRSTSYTYAVDFNYGVVSTLYKTTPYRPLRAVRSGQCGYFGDSDGDGICDDGNASGGSGGNPCTGGNTVFCDDNCPDTENADQADSDGNGVGDACEETLIGLAGLEAVAGRGEVAVIWSTASETANAGFNLYRATGKGGYEKITAELIPAEGSPTRGAVYEYVDTDVRNRTTYRYLLEDVDLNGVATPHGPVRATPRLLGW